MAWRSGEAHNMASVDRTKWVSLAAQVCHEGGDGALIVSAAQRQNYQVIEDYMAPLGWAHEVPRGVVLCWVVLYVWALAISRELRGLAGLVSSVCALPRSRTEIRTEGDMFLLQ